MVDTYSQLKNLLNEPVQTGIVSTTNPDGTVTVETPTGGFIRLLGSANQGDRVLYQGRQVLKVVPSLSYYEVEI